jgi:hypothetical protein
MMMKKPFGVLYQMKVISYQINMRNDLVYFSNEVEFFSNYNFVKDVSHKSDPKKNLNSCNTASQKNKGKKKWKNKIMDAK